MQKNSRKRGIGLTIEGYKKLILAKSLRERTTNFNLRYSNEELSGLTGLSQMTLKKIFRDKSSSPQEKQILVDKQSISICFSTFNLDLERGDYYSPDDVFESLSLLVENNRIFDIGEAPDISIFYGRDRELARLSEWIQIDGCRLVAILGMGGIGKTTIVTKLAEQLQSEFVTIVWRSLKNAPLLTDFIPKLIDIFTDGLESIPSTLDVSAQIDCLLKHFRQKRCLLVLDSVESIIGSSGDAREYPGYAELFQRIGESQHQSCLAIASCEKPQSIVPLEGENLAVRSLLLSGINIDDSDRIFDDKGLSVSRIGRRKLLELYSGNPLALKIVATSIRDLFNGDIDRFIDTDERIFEDITTLLDRQFNRLSPIEQMLMFWLAIEQEPVSPSDLYPEIVPAITKQQLLTAFSALGRRSLIESSGGKFSQQVVVMEYMIIKLIDRISEELVNWYKSEAPISLPLWLSHPLSKSQSPAYIQSMQKRLMLEPIADRLQFQFRQPEKLTAHLKSILTNIRSSYKDRPHYGGGNLLNLLRHFQIDLTGLNFAGMSMWQADLQGAILHDVDFSGADFSRTLTNCTLGYIFSMAFSPNSQIFVTGASSGQICLWQVGSRELISKFEGHQGWVWSLAFSPDGQILASGSQDSTIRLWHVQTGKVYHILQADQKQVLAVTFHPNGELLATAHSCGRVRIWDILTGELKNTHLIHQGQICSIRFSPDGKSIVTGSDDRTAKIWDVATGNIIQEITAHHRRIWSVRFSPNGQLLATASGDGTIKIWIVKTGQLLTTLPGYPKWTISISFSPDGKSLAVGNTENEVKIWDISNIGTTNFTPRPIATLQGHSSLVSLINFSPDGNLLITGDATRSIRLWHTHTWQEISCWKGYNNKVDTVMFMPCGTKVISGTQEGIVRIWDLQTGEILVQTSIEHDYALSSVDYNPHHQTIASAGKDHTILISDAITGKLIKTLSSTHRAAWGARFSPNGEVLASSSIRGDICLWLETNSSVTTLIGHQALVRSIAFSSDGKLLATASCDASWRLWDLQTRQTIHTQSGYGDWIWSLAFSPDGRFLAVSGANNIAELWQVSTCQLLHSFTGHTQDILTIEFSPDGQYLATGSTDRTIKIWQIETGLLIQNLTGHLDRINSLNYSPDGKLLVSGGGDETIKIWDLIIGACVFTYQPSMPYRGMNISEINGLSDAAIGSLKLLGAVSVGEYINPLICQIEPQAKTQKAA